MTPPSDCLDRCYLSRTFVSTYSDRQRETELSTSSYTGSRPSCGAGMAVQGKPGGGAVRAEWMNRRRLNPTELARLAQVSRSTVYVVLDSRSKSPSTMSQLAKGLATDPLDPYSVDYDVERAAEQTLLEAIGVLRVVPA